jgi:serine/threonine protein kinase
VTPLKKSRFWMASQASGLLTKEELNEALSALCLDERSRNTALEVREDELAHKLVEMGRINRWQMTQLLAGRTKFTLKDYRILDSLGRGGMAEVYKAEHMIMGRIVALKVLPRSKTTQESIARFRREIQAQSQLDHENLVRAFDAGHEGNVHFLVTEYIPGMDLRRYIRTHKRLSQRAAAAIICQAARALEHAHGRGLIHRDVKPGNLLITPDGHCKLLDLGLVYFLQQEDDELRDINNGKIVGTADYLAPEQIMAPETTNPVSDIYSLGCTLYYAVTGKVPFPGGSAKDKAKAHCKLQPITPLRWNPELSEEFIEVIHRMMDKDPLTRVQTAAEVIDLLAPFAGPDWKESAREVGAAAGHGPQRPQRRALIANLDDTQPVDGLDVEFVSDESLSQTSHPTHPMAAADEETSWMSEIRPKLASSGLSFFVIVMIAVGLLTAFVVLGAVAASLIW